MVFHVTNVPGKQCESSLNILPMHVPYILLFPPLGESVLHPIPYSQFPHTKTTPKAINSHIHIVITITNIMYQLS
jgi:hypothetical protein